MATLDCESYASALKSLGDLYLVEPDRIVQFLLSLDLEAGYENLEILKSSEDYLAELFHAEFGAPRTILTSVCWFHLTRVPLGTDFSEGILPLGGESLQKIWTTLASVLTDNKRRENLRVLKTSGVSHMYQNKTTQSVHSGPYGMLVRESAYQANAMGNHDYLECPEIVEDICWAYRSKFGEDIFSEVIAALNKCIVKFNFPRPRDLRYIPNVLRYCLHKARKEPLTIDANNCFDGHGEAVTRDLIRTIEYLS